MKNPIIQKTRPRALVLVGIACLWSSLSIGEAAPLRTVFVSPGGDDSNPGTTVDQPVASIGRAVELAGNAVRKANDRNRSVELVLRGGHYPLTGPIQIDSAGLWPLTIRAYRDEKPVISGGVKLPNEWKHETVNGVKVWTQVLPLVAEGKWYFRQLWVNDRRAMPPVMPKKIGSPKRFSSQDFYKIAELDIPRNKTTEVGAWKYASRNSFHYRPGEFEPAWRNLQDAWIMLNCRWYHNYMQIESVDGGKRLVRFQQSAVDDLLHAHPAHGKGVHEDLKKRHNPNSFYDTAYYRLYNVFETLSEPGEFYLDRLSGKLTYVPRKGEDPATAQVIAPRLNQLLVVSANTQADGHIRGLTLQGITFSHTTIDPVKHRGTGNNYQSTPDASLHLTGLNGVTISDCEFSHLGEIALGISGGSRNIDIVGNAFYDLASGATKSYGYFGATAEDIEPTPGTTMRIRFTDNHVYDGNLIMSGTTAVHFSKTHDLIVAFNDVHDFNYNGLNVGGGNGRNLQFSMFNTQVLNNHFHHLGRGHYNGNDMAGIYLHGIGFGSEIRGNVVHDVTCTAYGGNGIYIDANSSHFNVEDNLLYNCNTDAVNFKGHDNRLINNIIYNSGFGGIRNAGAYYRQIGAVVERNIIVPRGPAIYRSKKSPREMNVQASRNTVWSLTAGNGVTVAQKGYYGVVAGEQMTFADWCKRTGQGKGSVVADPMFVDPAPSTSGDFSLSTDSPALKAGFRPFGFRNVGPRPMGTRSLLPFKASWPTDTPEFQEYVGLVHAEMAAQQQTKSRGKKGPKLDHVE